MRDTILAIDQGTTSSRAILFDSQLNLISSAQEEFTQHFPHSGWVEHEPEDLWQTVLRSARKVIAAAPEARVAAIGITNQRETTLIWDRASGQPIGRAIVWQDRRTAETCALLKEQGHEARVTEVTGLLLDPYFSATKIAWLLDHIPGARARAERGELAFGTVDTWLIWKLTGGKVHATDATNASRTLLCDLQSGAWSEEMCRLFNVPMALLPEIRDCAADFGTTEPELLGQPIPILGVAGDQHAATVGQACFQPGMMKSTYGTGCFAVLNTGETPVMSQHRLLTTLAYQLSGKRIYALEGSIFIAGAVVQWLRDGLGLIQSAAETGPLAVQADPEQDVIIVPAFTGLGAPYWNPDCRGAIYGLTRGTGPAELARAALESVGLQTSDLIRAMRADWPDLQHTVLRVDGGLTASGFAMQYLADILDAPVDRPKVLETTALGAAWLAGMQAGICPSAEEFAKVWACDHRFTPNMPAEKREAKLERWGRAVKATLSV